VIPGVEDIYPAVFTDGEVNWSIHDLGFGDIQPSETLIQPKADGLAFLRLNKARNDAEKDW
jgi:hypothetical protein